jgi:hypothetical protein
LCLHLLKLANPLLSELSPLRRPSHEPNLLSKNQQLQNLPHRNQQQQKLQLKQQNLLEPKKQTKNTWIIFETLL